MAEQKDPFDGEYIGNVFGKKLTLIGAAIIIFFTALAAYRHWSMGVPPGLDLEDMENPRMEEEAPAEDTLKLEE